MRLSFLNRRALPIALVLLTGFSFSCTENKQPSSPSAGTLAPATPALPPETGGREAPRSDGAPSVPKDAEFTIYCQGIDGPAHVEQANAAKAELLRTTQMKDWYVIHEDTQSVIYYGFYKAIDPAVDPKEAARAQQEKKQVEAITDRMGDRVFTKCLFNEINTPDPAAPPQWNLTSADGYWSLQIAVYKDSPRRKEYAVEAVKEARAQGIPAYYYHGPVHSSVCIGAWPRSAVKAQDDAVASAPDPTQDLLVLPQPLPAGTEVRSTEGKRLRTLAPRLEPLDPSLLEAMNKYPYHAVNGEVGASKAKDPVTGKMETTQDPSFLVVIPHPGPSLLRGGFAPPPDATTLPPQQPTLPGAGKLRSLQD